MIETPWDVHCDPVDAGISTEVRKGVFEHRSNLSQNLPYQALSLVLGAEIGLRYRLITLLSVGR